MPQSNNRAQRALAGLFSGFAQSVPLAFAAEERNKAQTAARDAKTAETSRLEGLAREKEQRGVDSAESKRIEDLAKGMVDTALSAEGGQSVLAPEQLQRVIKAGGYTTLAAQLVDEIQRYTEENPAAELTPDQMLEASGVTGAEFGDMDRRGRRRAMRSAGVEIGPDTRAMLGPGRGRVMGDTASEDPNLIYNPVTGQMEHSVEDIAAQAQAKSVVQRTQAVPAPISLAREDLDFLQRSPQFSEAVGSLGWYNILNRAVDETISNPGQAGPADYAIVQAFNKILDPNSVTREGEFDRAVSLGGQQARADVIWGQFKVFTKWAAGVDMDNLTPQQKAEASRMLTPDVREAMRNMARLAIEERIAPLNMMMAQRAGLTKAQFNGMPPEIAATYAPLTIESLAPYGGFAERPTSSSSSTEPEDDVGLPVRGEDGIWR